MTAGKRLRRALKRWNGKVVLALVAGLAHFGRRSGLRLIAEGVERQEETACLLEAGVEFAQGFLVGRPMRSEPRVARAGREKRLDPSARSG